MILGGHLRAVNAETALGIKIDAEIKCAGDVETDLYTKTTQLTSRYSHLST